MNTVHDTIDTDCNCLYMPYCDGASFSGYRPKGWPVPGFPGETVLFRGITNFDATMSWALEHGLGSASELVLTGGSAGGLSTFLHTDRAAARVQAVAPEIKVRSAPVVGYFLDHDNFLHTAGEPNTRSWSKANYTSWMKYIYAMQNLTFGDDGGLTDACRRKFPTDPGLCFMSPHMVDAIKTPVFVFNSKLDSWQLSNEFQSNYTTKEQQAGALSYAQDFVRDLAPVRADPKNGAFITSCICHSCRWSDPDALAFDEKTVYQHYAAWMAGETSGEGSIHIDTRGPNGDGSIDHPLCLPWVPATRLP